MNEATPWTVIVCGGRNFVDREAVTRALAAGLTVIEPQ